MPELSRFFGIVIYMYYADHAPPHFHAEYGGDEALIRIEDLGVLRGNLSTRALNLVREWADIHRAELIAAWNAASQKQKPSRIEPLK